MAVLATIKEKALLAVALINSLTLQSKLVSTSSPYPGRSPHLSLSIHAVAQLMDKRCQREFVHALNHHLNYECITSLNGKRISVSLCATGVFGEEWSHILVLGDAKSVMRPA